MAKKKLILWAAALALALPLIIAGTASAVHIGDGSKPNGTTGGWDITDFGKCASGVDSAGNLVFDTDHNLSRADCIDHIYSTYTTAATCTATTATPGTTRTSDDVSHYWSSVCVDGSGNGINLDGLDRTASNCALKGGTMKNSCTNAWVYTGPANDGAPGFCYTTINVTSSLPTPTQNECPTNLVGYAWTSSQCRYSYGIAGYTTAVINKKDGSGSVASGTFVDLSGYNQGQCILNNFSWSTGVTKSGTSPVATTPLASTAANVETSRAGCLECYNQKV